MKKYTIKDKSGIKKTIYAKDLAHALTFVDSKTKDDANRSKTLKFFINNREVSEDEYTKSFIKEAAREHQSATTAKRVINEDKESAKVNGKNTFISELGRKFLIIYDSKAKDEAKSLSDALSKHNNNIKDAYVEEWWGQTDESPKAVARRYNLQLTIRARRGDETLYRFTGSNANIERAMDDGYFYSVENKAGKYVKDFITKDEANLPTTIQALVNDEEAAIKAYEVAIKNLEGKIDETQMQVLINIMKDERRHVENLYAILNGQVTEKNVEDNKMKDAAPGVDEKKFNRLVSYFDAWGKPSKGELQDVVNYYRLNSATAYQLLIYWGYKDEFKKLHFYDSLSKAVK